MRIVQVNPEKEWRLRNLTQPSKSMIDDDRRRRSTD